MNLCSLYFPAAWLSTTPTHPYPTSHTYISLFFFVSQRGQSSLNIIITFNKGIGGGEFRKKGSFKALYAYLLNVTNLLGNIPHIISKETLHAHLITLSNNNTSYIYQQYIWHSSTIHTSSNRASPESFRDTITWAYQRLQQFSPPAPSLSHWHPPQAIGAWRVLPTAEERLGSKNLLCWCDVSSRAKFWSGLPEIPWGVHCVHWLMSWKWYMPYMRQDEF